MIFHSASNIPRPVRLNENIRRWAWESLHGKYGDEALKTPFVSLDSIQGFDALTQTQKQDAAIRLIAQEAPVRICEYEKICGSATLGAAIGCAIPAAYAGRVIFPAVSHLTIRYDKVLKEGLNSYLTDIKERLEDDTLTDAQVEFLHSLENVIECIRIWHARYMEATKVSRPDLYALLSRVPFEPARNFTEAVQSLWFIFAFVRLCGNWPGIGRIDMLLGDYLKRDIECGAITLDEAREILASFFIKGCEWIQSETPVGSGDAQHYQNIILAGIDENGREITNDITFLVLDIVEELAISDFPITVRMRSDSPDKLKERVAAVMKHGGGIVAVYNEELILRALKELGYPESEARNFANDGCWEVQVPGKTDFTYMPFDALQIFNEAIGLNADNGEPDFKSAEEVYDAFKKLLNETVINIYRGIAGCYKFEGGSWHSAHDVIPTSVISLFEDGCIENARSYFDCGPVYIVRSPHIGGAPDVANSIYAIQKAVFDDHLITFRELVHMLKNNWEDGELLRLKIKNSYVYYGNDSEGADEWHARLLNDFADMVIKCNELSECPVKFIPGVSTFGRQIDWLPNRCATAFGYKKGDILSGNDSPVPGTDTRGATSIIKSYCKSDLVKQSCGAALDIKIFPDSLCGDNGTAVLVGLIDGFIELGGFFMQLDTVDTQTLIEAQKDPQRFKTLSVRVSGWNARFVTLNREWQNMIIERSSQKPV